MTESTLQSSWLNGEETKTIIIGLMKKTGASQFQIAQKILDTKTKMQELLKNFDKTKDTNFKTKGAFNELLTKEFQDFIHSLPFGAKVAHKFIAIAKDPMIEKYIGVAPVAYNTLFDKCRGLTENTWLFLIEKGLTPFTTANTIMDWKTEYQTVTAKQFIENKEKLNEDVWDAVADATGICDVDTAVCIDAINTSDIKVEEETDEEVIDTTSEVEIDTDNCDEEESVPTSEDDETTSEQITEEEFTMHTNAIACMKPIGFINATPNVTDELLGQLTMLLEETIAEFKEEEGLETFDVSLSMNPAVLSDNPNYNIEFDVAA